MVYQTQIDYVDSLEDTLYIEKQDKVKFYAYYNMNGLSSNDSRYISR